VWYIFSNVSGEHAVSIFCPEDGGSIFLRNVRNDIADQEKTKLGRSYKTFAATQHLLGQIPHENKLIIIEINLDM
jgi:hypothetical protein